MSSNVNLLFTSISLGGRIDWRYKLRSHQCIDGKEFRLEEITRGKVKMEENRIMD
jgi:hypothetical protein